MHNGFQLIELMIVIAIIGLLSVVAYPSLGQHFTTVHRFEAQRALLVLATKLEEYELTHNTYSEATFSLLRMKEFTKDDHYRLKMQTDEKGYLISAIPEDKLQDVLTMDSHGRKSWE